MGMLGYRLVDYVTIQGVSSVTESQPDLVKYVINKLNYQSNIMITMDNQSIQLCVIRYRT